MDDDITEDNESYSQNIVIDYSQSPWMNPIHIVLQSVSCMNGRFLSLRIAASHPSEQSISDLALRRVKQVRFHLSTPRFEKLLHKSSFAGEDVYGHKQRHDEVVFKYGDNDVVCYIEDIMASYNMDFLTCADLLFWDCCNKLTLRRNSKRGT